MPITHLMPSSLLMHVNGFNGVKPISTKMQVLINASHIYHLPDHNIISI